MSIIEYEPVSSPHAPRDAAGPPRFDLYAAIHKALRSFMSDTLARLGRFDPADPADVAATLDQLAGLLAFCRQHVSHENEFVHPAIEARCPGVSAHIATEHESHRHAIAALEAEAALFRAQPTAAAAHRLYRQVAVFIGDNFIHMDFEEVAHNGALWSAYADAELIAIHQRLLAAIPADEMAIAMRWMLPALNPAERAAIAGDAIEPSETVR
ncbi:MAG: hemerythrin domain-containing protein [Lautropia sp.]